MNKYLDKILNLLFCNDIKCIFCEDELASDNSYCLCDNCMQNLPLNNNFCQVCGTAISDMGVLCESCKNIKNEFNFCRSALIYENDVVSCIHNLKYHNSKYLAQYLSNIIYDYYLKTPQICDVDVILPVPLNKKRLKERGFNQSELLLSAFVANGKNVKVDILERVINTQTQTNLSRKERLVNLENAFVVKNKSEIVNKNVLIVDDVFTTGSTINECAKVLKKAGAKSVFGLTLASANFYAK